MKKLLTLILFFVFSHCAGAYAQVSVPNMPDGSPLLGTDYFYIARGTTDFHATQSELATSILQSAPANANLVAGYNASGVYTPLTLGNGLAVSSGILSNTLRAVVNVTQPPYNAKCDGTTDDSASFTAAYNSGFPVYIPETTTCCAVNNVNVPTNSTTFGDNGPWYSTLVGSRSCIKPASGATTILNVNGSQNLFMQSIDVIGSTSGNFSSGIQCITGGSTNMTLFNMSIRFCGNGGVGDLTNQTATFQSIGTYYYADGQTNQTGAIVNLVDSHVIGGYVVSSYDGIYFPSGSNDVDVDGLKTEFNIDYGYRFDDNAQRDIVRGGVCDNNSNGCIKFGAASFITIGDILMKRNGSTNTYGKNADIFFNGGSNNIILTGINTTTGPDDGGGGAFRPQYAISFNSASDNAITIGDSDFCGTLAGPFFFNATPTNLSISNVNCAFPLSIQGEYDLTGELVMQPLATSPTPVVTHSGTAGVVTWTYKIVACTSNNYCSAGGTAASTSTGNATLTSSNFNIITIPPITGAAFYKVYRTAHGTTPSTNGLIATVYPSQYSGSIFVNDTALAGDAATATAINNTAAIVPPSNRKGTFVCTAGGSITVANTTVLAASDILITLNAAGGTVAPPTVKSKSVGTNFIALCGGSDTSTYNYTIFN